MTTKTTAERDYELLPKGSFADEIDEDAVLQQAAAILARRGEAAQPVEPIPPTSIPEGDSIVVHVLDTFSFDGWQRDRHYRGETLVVSFDQVNNEQFWNRRTGRNSFDEMLAQESSIAPGPWPEWQPTWRWGDDVWREQRAEAVAAASIHRQPEARALAMRAVVEQFGPAKFEPQAVWNFYSELFGQRDAHDYAENAEEATRRALARGKKGQTNA